MKLMGIIEKIQEVDIDAITDDEAEWWVVRNS